jgi:TolB protein
MKTFHEFIRDALFYLLLILSFGCKSESENETEKAYKLKIAYNVFYDSETDNYEVFSMDLDGSNKQNITNFKGVEWTYYAHEDDLYFVSDKDSTHRNYRLYKMKADGSKKKLVNNIRLSDSWHSSRNSGSEFIVLPHKSVDTAFYIVNINGTIIDKIRPDLKYFSDPAFSPDGKQIAFRGARYETKRDSSFVDEIYIMNADGSNLKQLTHYPETDTTAMWYAYKAGPPKWHPTENFISYGSFQNGKYRLFGVSFDGKKQWELFESKKGHVYHDWSPNGKWIVMDAAMNDQAPFHIELMNWETKDKKVLTDSTYQYHQSPVFVKVYE